MCVCVSITCQIMKNMIENADCVGVIRVLVSSSVAPSNNSTNSSVSMKNNGCRTCLLSICNVDDKFIYFTTRRS